MLMLAEQTVWSDGFRNGVYLTDDSKSRMFGFAPFGQSEFKMCKYPINIDTRGRKFLELHRIADEQAGVKIEGSKGAVYYVLDGKCSCPGFKYRGVCKHV